MCNRYSLSKKQERVITREYGSIEFYFMERFNIAPTEFAQVIAVENGKLVSREMKWGIETPFGMLTNTRAESTNKKTYEESFKNCRCLVPATGFYEWKKGKPAQPYFIVRASRNVFYFAGLYKDNEFSIITKPSASFVRSIHDRMPIILAESQFDWWLTSAFDAIAGPGGIAAQGVSEITLEAYPVTTRMTNSRFKGHESVEPIALTQMDFLPLEIDNPDIRWHDMNRPPERAINVLLLVNDEMIMAGQWTGTKWEYPADVKSEPLKWRPAR
ncbi:MAG TPA: SOS response-associated peptidase [Alphaproteobacteria bacterium]|nr:SOS response-associated peptidase [Alphaproteobacteria bacterium]